MEREDQLERQHSRLPAQLPSPLPSDLRSQTLQLLPGRKLTRAESRQISKVIPVLNLYQERLQEVSLSLHHQNSLLLRVLYHEVLGPFSHINHPPEPLDQSDVPT